MNPIAAVTVEQRDSGRTEMQLESLRLLLLKTAESLCAGDAVAVEKAATKLMDLAAQSSSMARELAIADFEQKRRLLLLPLLEARAHYLATLRRWRRSLRLRRSLLNLQTGDGSYGNAEVSRWC